MNNIFCKEKFFRKILFSLLFCIGFINTDIKANDRTMFLELLNQSVSRDIINNALVVFVNEHFLYGTNCDMFWGFDALLDWYESCPDSNLSKNRQFSSISRILLKTFYPISQSQIDRAKQLGIPYLLIDSLRDSFITDSDFIFNYQDAVSRILNQQPTDFCIFRLVLHYIDINAYNFKWLLVKKRNSIDFTTAGYFPFELMLNWYEFNPADNTIKNRQLQTVTYVLFQGRFKINQHQIDRAKRIGISGEFISHLNKKFSFYSRLQEMFFIGF